MTFIRRPFLLLLLTLGILSIPSGVAHAQVITAQVTVTNITTNGYTMSVNGHLRTWTNYITSANNQIQVATNGSVVLGTDATNLFWAYAIYPENNIRLSQIATNVLQFQGYYSGVPVTIALSSGWGSVTYYTNTPTNFIVVSVPSNGVPVTTMSIWERTNIESGLISLLDDNCMVAPVNASDPAWVEFLSTNFGAAMTNFVLLVGTNATNFAERIGLNATNFSLSLGALETNQTTNMGFAITNYVNTVSNNSLAYDYTVFALAASAFPWQDSSHDVFITNGPGNIRFFAQNTGGSAGGATTLYDSASIPFENSDGSGDLFLTDINGYYRFEMDDPSQNGSLPTAGATAIRSGNGNLGLEIMGQSTGVKTYAPIVFDNSVWPCASIGSATNFFDQEENSGTSGTTIDDVVIPANLLTNNGDTIRRTLIVSLAPGGGTRDIQIVFDGLLAWLDTGALTMTGAGFAAIDMTITRVNSSTALYSGKAAISGSSTATQVISGSSVSGINWTSTIDFHLEVTSASGATGNIKDVTDTVWVSPAPVWSTLP